MMAANLLIHSLSKKGTKPEGKNLTRGAILGFSGGAQFSQKNGVGVQWWDKTGRSRGR